MDAPIFVRATFNEGRNTIWIDMRHVVYIHDYYGRDEVVLGKIYLDTDQEFDIDQSSGEIMERYAQTIRQPQEDRNKWLETQIGWHP